MAWCVIHKKKNFCRLHTHFVVLLLQKLGECSRRHPGLFVEVIAAQQCPQNREAPWLAKSPYHEHRHLFGPSLVGTKQCRQARFTAQLPSLTAATLEGEGLLGLHIVKYGTLIRIKNVARLNATVDSCSAELSTEELSPQERL